MNHTFHSPVANDIAVHFKTWPVQLADVSFTPKLDGFVKCEFLSTRFIGGVHGNDDKWQEKRRALV